jgi:hypothetical protein
MAVSTRQDPRTGVGYYSHLSALGPRQQVGDQFGGTFGGAQIGGIGGASQWLGSIEQGGATDYDESASAAAGSGAGGDDLAGGGAYRSPQRRRKNRIKDRDQMRRLLADAMGPAQLPPQAAPAITPRPLPASPMEGTLASIPDEPDPDAPSVASAPAQQTGPVKIPRAKPPKIQLPGAPAARPLNTDVRSVTRRDLDFAPGSLRPDAEPGPTVADSGLTPLDES